MFKNLMLYRLKPQAFGRDGLAARLSDSAFKPCNSRSARSLGWVPPRNGSLIHSVGNQWLLSLMTEQRVLPPLVVTQEVARRAKKQADKQGFSLGRKSMAELKDSVIAELLPRAFVQSRTTQVWIDPKNGWVGVDASSEVLADSVMGLLCKSISTKPITTKVSPTSVMADWLAAGEASGGFTLDRDGELKSVDEEKAAVRYTRHSLEGEEIKAHLVAGKLPTRLALTWGDRLSFVLTDRMEIKRLRFLDVFKLALENEAPEDAFDAEFALMAGEFSWFVPALLDVLGGEVE